MNKELIRKALLKTKLLLVSQDYNVSHIDEALASLDEDMFFNNIASSVEKTNTFDEACESAFPVPVRTEVEDIPCVETTCEYFDNQMPDNCGGECGGEPALCTCVKYLKSSKLITDFIQSREENPVEFCEWKPSTTPFAKGFYESSCNLISTGKDLRYCTYCGKPIKIKE